MKPTFSIIVFTVLSGGGLGLAALLALFADSLSSRAFITAAGISFVLIAGGLSASVLHLANPKNAWRAVMRVRTSWLSREAVSALIFFPLFILWAALHLTKTSGASFLAWVILICAMVIVFCTAMIYQSLKPIAAWHHPLTAINYLLFALLCGAVLFCTIATFDGIETTHMIFIVLFFTIFALIGKILHYRRLGKTEDVRIGRAVGFTNAKARLLDAGNTGQTFLTREFIFTASAMKLRLLKAFSLAICFIAPILVIILTQSGYPKIAIVFVILLFAGLFAERWLFFAEARHTVRAYHGMGSP